MAAMNASAEAIVQGLDDAQLAAATTLHGPVRIIAGAGAGKTRTVTRRIAYACASGAWDPTRTLAVTFSVKAAAEMRSRLASLGVGEQATASTFHAAALHQLRQVWPDICEAPFPHVIREPGRAIDQCMRRVLGTDQFGDAEVRAILAEINWCKVSLIAPSDYSRVCAATHRQPPAGLEVDRLVDVMQEYERVKTSHGEIDFNDILLLTCHILDDFPEEAAHIRAAIGWLTVDEYQDVSPLQHRLMSLWLNGNRDVCVVGDPAQTIYSFAGASSYDLLGFASEFAPLSADIDLGIDYRSTPQVVGCANRVLASAANREDYLKLSALRPGGARVGRTVYDDDDEEARGVAMRIARMVSQGAAPDDFAVLTRINAQHRVVCRALREQGLHYRVRRDAGWQHSALEDEGAGMDHAQSQARQEALEQIGAGGQQGSQQGTQQGVTLSTIHAAKGLEFKHVFIIGCSEGLLPFSSPSPGEQLEEERRLMYVGVTRAEDTLHLSYARRKDSSGGIARAPSRFL
ncbi:MAG: ATP-dependent helicase [Bifidobacterium tibiigranuli]|uniref:ATP-dependent helicase n=1 Tax=Bifidobacterium tibiigranuli TaxID=2172043 RepID=UPI0026F30522|nr:ATP-dependent helicase [Bifidobacterium tibiigranuli]MCI1673697.1 ATP-dependent helicase [Bifidobacterium tibiigranuli]MCI1712953.1 ATP-dependent helicase [Bifidobacterium tibiigranuli]